MRGRTSVLWWPLFALVALGTLPVPAAAQPTGPSAAVPAAPEPAWYLEVAGGACDVFVQEYGPPAADTVVVLHGGWGAEHSYLLDAFAGLGDDYHFVFYDQRGSLRSPCPDSLVSVDAHLADLEALRRELRLERMHLAGHSMGTYLTMLYLRRHPRRTGGIVHLASNLPRLPRGPAEQRLLERHQTAMDTLQERAACRRERREEGLAKPDSLLSDRQASDKWRLRFACANIHRVERWRALEGGRAYFDGSAADAARGTMPEDVDFEREITEHSCPLKVIQGAQDFSPHGDDLLEMMAGSIRGMTVTVIPEAGHNAWIDAPAAFRRALRKGLEEATACRA